jgi:hypothetical protein
MSVTRKKQPVQRQLSGLHSGLLLLLLPLRLLLALELQVWRLDQPILSVVSSPLWLCSYQPELNAVKRCRAIRPIWTAIRHNDTTHDLLRYRRFDLNTIY